MIGQKLYATRQLAKSALPSAITSRWNKWRISAMIRKGEAQDRGRSAGEVFDEIYRRNKWGGDSGEAFSGSGSVGLPVERYLSTINEFIRINRIDSVLDIGCGDYRVGKRIACEKYIGVDVAPSVIEENNRRYGRASREFVCLDAAGSDRLPEARLCLIRQVLQHLSNAQISAILAKLDQFPFVIITEHQIAATDFVTANADKVHGPFTRLFSGSAVYLDQPPFNLNMELVLEVQPSTEADEPHSRGWIRTFLIRNPRPGVDNTSP
jgi:SAM-dependent methyltransferase